jgi:glycosyltransferase involved in cell wall biosynthesis
MPKPFPHTVLQVVPTLDTGGVEQTVLDVARCIITEGGKAVVASFGGRLEGELIAMGAKFYRMPVHSKNPYIQFKNYFALKALIKAEGIEIIHVRSRAPAIAALKAARACGIGSVTTYHGIYNAKSGLKRWYNAQMTKADVTIANSEFTKAHILSNFSLDEAKVIAIPRGVDLNRFSPESLSLERIDTLAKAWGLEVGKGPIKFILAGRLTRWKGQTLILEALSLLNTKDIQVIFVGDDQGRHEFRAELEAKISHLGLKDQVKLVGHCSDMPAAYALCDFALAPSLEPEAFGRTAVEPQAMARPVLAADHGATSETVEDGVSGWRIPPNDAPSWAKAIKTASDTPLDIRQKMGQSGQAHVHAHFSLEVMCDKTLEVYRRLL